MLDRAYYNMYYYFYRTTNNVNGKYYYGVHSTDNLDDGYRGSGKALKAAIKKYNKDGVNHFTTEILKFFDSEKEMYDYEREMVDMEKVRDVNCYNIALGGSGGNTLAGKSEEELKIIFAKPYGFGEKISKALTGRKRSPEHCKHLSESKKGKPSPYKGIPRTEESKQKISRSLQGHKRSPESIAKSREGLKKKWEDPEFRQMMSERRKGRIVTEETRKKQSESRKKFWDNKKKNTCKLEH